MKKNKGFTIIELLTVISIIVLLMAIAVPGVRRAKQVAMDLRQSAQFKDIGIGLELWRYDTDEYPDSSWSATNGAEVTTGAHRLAEAMLGRDGHGFDSKSTWDAEDDAGFAYTSTAPYSDREDIYIDDGKHGRYQLAQVYDYANVTWDAYPGDVDDKGVGIGVFTQAGVLTDMFRKKRITMPGALGVSVKVGSPILYFRAKQTDIFDSFDINTRAASVFNYEDNVDILSMGHNTTQEENPFYAATGIDDFYASLVNPRVRSSNDPVPYNKDTYVLISAGADGLYGTKDDITNTPR